MDRIDHVQPCRDRGIVEAAPGADQRVLCYPTDSAMRSHQSRAVRDASDAYAVVGVGSYASLAAHDLNFRHGRSRSDDERRIGAMRPLSFGCDL